MADELAYESNKRKYEESPPPARRASGFSSPPPPSDGGAYKAVPPPMNEIELAKQKAQEIAARLLSTADPSKKARVENGGGGGFDSSEATYGYGQKPLGSGLSGPPQGGAYGYPSESKKIEIPNGKVGVIIGKGGETIKNLQMQSGAKIQVTRDMDADPNSATREVELMGTPDQIARAEQLVNDVLSEAEAGGSGMTSRRLAGPPAGAEQFVMKVANNKVGLVIGKGGETIRNIQASTGARVQVIPLHLPPGDTSKERTVQIDGTTEQIEAAKQMVYEVTSENRMRNPSISSGYSMQGYQHTRPPTNWAPPGPPMQQPGYGYTQPGAYPGPSPQYMNQPPYAGYPPQPPSSGYPTSWDQSSAPQNQQGSQGGSYDYYNQQQQTHPGSGAPSDGSGYGYSQAPSYSQGQAYYGQDGYGGYHSGTGQSGYGQNPSATTNDQQQQGYASSYSNAPNPNPTSDGPQGTQGDTSQPPGPGESQKATGQPSPNPNYPPQGATTQPGYGVPPSSQSGYGTTQPPSSYPSYGTTQPPQQSGYAYSQGGYYGQADPNYATSGYQAGYGGVPQPYGAPPAYGQQPPPPPPYHSAAYGGSGYSQPPSYSTDGSAGGGNDASTQQPVSHPAAKASSNES